MYTISCRATKIKWNSFLGDPSIRQQIFEPWLLWPLEVSTNNDLLKKNPSKFARILQNSSHWGQTNKAIATTKIQCFFPIRSSGTHYTYFDMCINIDRLCMCRRYIHIIFAMYVFIFPSFLLTFFFVWRNVYNTQTRFHCDQWDTLPRKLLSYVFVCMCLRSLAFSYIRIFYMDFHVFVCVEYIDISTIFLFFVVALYFCSIASICHFCIHI